MAMSPEDFRNELAEIRSDLSRQGALVTDMASRAFQAIYERDVASAREIVARDDEVDKADIEIERHMVDLLVRASHDSCGLRPETIRSSLTSIKVNNELERVADAATAVAEMVVRLGDRTTPFPKTLQVMTNSVVGIVRDSVRAFAGTDEPIARSVLASEGTVLSFNGIIVRDAEERVADGRLEVELAFELHGIASQAVIMADHCTNIAEQVIYESTGHIVRHTQGEWVQLPEV